MPAMSLYKVLELWEKAGHDRNVCKENIQTPHRLPKYNLNKAPSCCIYLKKYRGLQPLWFLRQHSSLYS